MSDQDLYKMLGLDDELPSLTSSAPSSSPTRTEEEPTTINPSVMRLTKWDVERGQALIEQSSLPLTKEAVGDFYSLCFNHHPELLDGQCDDALRQSFIEEMAETPDYEELRLSTIGNQTASEMAARKIADQFILLQQKQKPGNPPDGIQSLLAASSAINEAKKERDEIDEFALALGDEPGMMNGPEGFADQQRIAQTFQQVRNNSFVRAVCERAGRFRRAAQSKQKSKIKHGMDDIVGVTMGGDLSNILPLDLAMIGDEVFGDLALRRMVERQMMSRERRENEKQKKGPIVVCVDESGSMNLDERIINAKAFALTMAWIAKKQGRYCCLVGFAAGREHSMVILRPGHWDQVALLKWIGHFFRGGTTLDVPCQVIPEKWQDIGAPHGKTDMILITDGQVSIEDRMRKSFLAWKEKEKVNLYSLLVSSHTAGDLESISNDLTRISEITPAAVDHCLGI